MNYVMTVIELIGKTRDAAPTSHNGIRTRKL